MKPSDFKLQALGQCLQSTSPQGERYHSFLPDPLPPLYQPSAEVLRLNEQAAIALGETRGLGILLPNPALLINGFLGSEAAASTRIEGTRADLRDLVLDDAGADGTSDELKLDVGETRNYLEAMEVAWKKAEDRPISSTFIRELHTLLLRGVRGQDRSPGAFRDHQVRLGGTSLTNARFVPPPHEQLPGLIENLVAYITDDTQLPNLIKLAIIHYQFETIHPFSDGNGRLGRLLMPLLLKEWGYLELPILPLSEYFEEHKDTYIDLLFAVSSEGVWDEWNIFVLNAIRAKSNEAVRRSQQILLLRERLRSQYQSARAGKILTIIDTLFERPAITVRMAAESSDLTFAAANTIVNRLVSDGVLELLTEGSRGRVFFAPTIFAAMMGSRKDQD